MIFKSIDCPGMYMSIYIYTYIHNNTYISRVILSLAFDCETWALKKRDWERIQAAEMIIFNITEEFHRV